MRRLRTRARLSALLGLLAWVGLAELLPLAHLGLHADLAPHVHGAGAAPRADGAGAGRRPARCHGHADATAGDAPARDAAASAGRAPQAERHCHARGPLGAPALRLPGPEDARSRATAPDPAHGDGSLDHHAVALLRPLAPLGPLGVAPSARLPAPESAPRLTARRAERAARARGPPPPASA